MRPLVITFTNLFPSAAFPMHGLFVRDRMRRVVARGGYDWAVVAPVPAVPWPLRRASDRRAAAMPPREDVGGVEVHHPRYFHLPGVSLGAQARRIERAALPAVAELARGRRCVVDAHYVYPDGVAALRIAARLGLPCFVTARGTDVNVLAERPAVRRQLRAAAPAAHALLAVSAPLCRRLAAAADTAPDAVVLARNGVDLERFHPGDPVTARRALGLPEGRVLVLAVGRLVEDKGFHHAARALRSLPGDIDLVVIGEGPDRGRIALSAPPGRVHFLGARPPDDVALAYRACRTLVLPSVREGWPNVVTEALASGIPVVATPVGAVPDILTVPYAGSLVRHGDHRALAAELQRFLRAPPDPARVRAFAERFSWDHPVARIVELFDAALGAEVAP